MTLLLITIPSVLFWSFDCRLTFSKTPIGIFGIVISVVFYLTIMTFLVLSSVTDPGIIPRASNSEKEDIWERCKIEYSDGLNSILGPNEPRIYENISNGKTVKLKFCSTCRIYRPPGTHHCRICDNCIRNFDHHCPFIGNCVGYRNYRYFFAFISFLTIYIFVILGLTITHVVIFQKETKDFGKTLSESWGSSLTAAICLLSVFPMCGLTGFHWNLLGTGTTTYEYSSNNSKCSCLKLVKNFWKLIGMDIGISLVDGRRFVDSTNPLENKPKYPDDIDKFTSVRVFEISSKITTK